MESATEGEDRGMGSRIRKGANISATKGIHNRATGPVLTLIVIKETITDITNNELCLIQ